MKLTRRGVLQGSVLLPGLWALPATALAQERSFRSGDSLLGTPKYKEGFARFDYVNPDAPKGGRVNLGVLGSFDSINPYTIFGESADTGVNEALMMSSLDEPFSQYGLLAEGMWHPEDYSSAVYRLRPEARFTDGEPVKVEDVIYSFDTVMANLPFYQGYYKDVLRAEKTGEREVTFVFNVKNNRELPHIVGQLPVLPKHWWTGKDVNGQQRDVSKPSLEPPLGSAPYKVKSVSSGQSFITERVKDYWGEKLAVNVGSNNFDEIETQFYLDDAVMFEAFKGGRFDIIRERTAKGWATNYDFPAVKNGNVIKEKPRTEGAEGMQAWVVNLRRERFQDPRVRRALNLAFDFEWANTNLFFGEYIRSRSFFNNCELEAKGLPDAEELALLEPLKDKLPAEVFATEYKNPDNTDPQQRRKNLREAQVLMAEAGWNAVTAGGKRVLQNAKGETFKLEILLDSPAFQRIALPYQEQLEILGFAVSLKLADSAQYEKRVREFDYDMMNDAWGQSLSPGNEQREYWGSDFANKTGSRNLAGIQNPAIDTLIGHVINAKDRKALITATRALDRALIWNHYVIPMWFYPFERIARWRYIAHPEPLPSHTISYPDTWWFDAKAAAEIKKG